MARGKTVAVNERGLRIGEDHQNARFTNRDVDLVREIHEDHGFSYGYIADWFAMSKAQIAKICQYNRRAQTPDAWKVVRK